MSVLTIYKIIPVLDIEPFRRARWVEAVLVSTGMTVNEVCVCVCGSMCEGEERKFSFATKVRRVTDYEE